MSDEEGSEPLAYKSPDLDTAQSRRADTFSWKGRLIKPVNRYSPKINRYIFMGVVCMLFVYFD